MPFTNEQFLEVFAAYNRAVFPMQLVLVSAALVAIFLSIRPNKISGKAVTTILAFFWLWMGVVYHLLFFSSINRGAIFFGLFFILQSLILFYTGVLKDKLSFGFHYGWKGMVGALLILFALVIYPLLGLLFGHIYPQSPTFGLPCPTTIFTFGLLLWSDKKVPWYVLPIPLFWSLIGFSAAFTLGILEDIGLPIAGIIGVGIMISTNRKAATSPNGFQKVLRTKGKSGKL